MWRKLRTAVRIAGEGGVPALYGTVLQKGREFSRRRPGGLVVLDGCRFDLTAVSQDVRNLLLSGEYERPERASLGTYIDPTLPVIELGASIGVISCLTNKLLADPARHVVVEANPAILSILEANLQRNDCHFQIVHAALAYGRSSLEFPVHESSLKSSAYQPQAGPTVNVPAKTLAEIRQSAGFNRFTLICDIEGSEIDLIRHELDLIADSVPTLLIELHPQLCGNEKVQELIDALSARQFLLAEQEHYACVFRRTGA